MLKITEEDLRKIKEQDPELYHRVVTMMEYREKKIAKQEAIANAFWDMVEKSDKKL